MPIKMDDINFIADTPLICPTSSPLKWLLKALHASETDKRPQRLVPLPDSLFCLIHSLSSFDLWHPQTLLVPLLLLWQALLDLLRVTACAQFIWINRMTLKHFCVVGLLTWGLTGGTHESMLWEWSQQATVPDWNTFNYKLLGGVKKRGMIALWE